MTKDPILEELRQHRRDIEAETNNDPKEYYAYLMRIQKQYEDRVANTIPAVAPLINTTTKG